jgi:hypothetical protein
MDINKMHSINSDEEDPYSIDFPVEKDSSSTISSLTLLPAMGCDLLYPNIGTR